MGKKYDNLWDSLISFENLLLAFQKARRGKRFQPEVADFENHRERYLFELQKRLIEQSYQPSGYSSFKIYDPKERLVSAAPFHDRVIHHALCNVTEFIFERMFIADSYANRKGKGVHKSLDKAQDFARKSPFVLQCDIRQFFPSIDHEIIKHILFHKIIDPKVRWLIEQIIKSGESVLKSQYEMVYYPNDDLFAANRARGLPIGNLTSQLWANVYMNELDQFVKRQLKCKSYVRYVDDFLLFSESKSELWEWKAAIVEFLYTIRLSLHMKSSTVYPVSNGIPFLGFTLFPDNRRLKNRNVRMFEKRLRKKQSEFREGEISYSELNASVKGWVAHALHGDTYKLRSHLLSRTF